MTNVAILAPSPPTLVEPGPRGRQPAPNPQTSAAPAARPHQHQHRRRCVCTPTRGDLLADPHRHVNPVNETSLGAAALALIEIAAIIYAISIIALAWATP